MCTLAGPLTQCLGVAAWQVSAALMAKNIGGGLNFMGVADALQVNSVAVTSALAVDNLLGLLYFPLCGYLCQFVPRHEVERGGEDARGSKASVIQPVGSEDDVGQGPTGAQALPSMAGAVCLGTVIAALAAKIACTPAQTSDSIA